MDNDKRLVFECVAMNQDAKKRLKRLEKEGILKRIRVTKTGGLDKRTLKKERKL